MGIPESITFVGSIEKEALPNRRKKVPIKQLFLEKLISFKKPYMNKE